VLRKREFHRANNDTKINEATQVFNENREKKTIDEYCKSHLDNCSFEKQYSISMTKVDNLTTASYDRLLSTYNYMFIPFIHK
jgi:hypothetical protein